ncbi:MAG: type VI secretion system ImpA family N-terminal domain-containing protein, partial [Pyrinomonadaceae bacterium]
MSSVVEATPAASTAAAAVVDVEALLAPIAGENPSGENLQFTGLYDQVREARRSEDSLEQGDWKREPKAADWDQVESLTTEALRSRTKDLQFCAWMTEALVKNYGYV